ncbi:hypothetical protein [Streptomyces antibioticus]|uniref:hypothetical protein n=1 Tax=Streptomyces antibioticus TaxID=1890 RepID=UPI00225764CE|nr:hypothetical protein [Streptomyces antibioticus]MCX4739842.1 hypothetical protein [Streptomyces antibioticus]
MKKVMYVFAGLAAAGAGSYLVIYLYRWQWQRALICGVLLLVVEVLLFGIVLLGRLTRIEERLRDTDRRQREAEARQEDVLARLRQPARAREDTRFRWLEDPSDRTYVFVPVLMVTGVLLSGLAWVVQRIASATTRPAERRLAGRLAVLGAPGPEGEDERGGPDEPAGLPPERPRMSWGRTARGAVVVVVAGALTVALVAGIAELTQTREEEPNGSAATSVLVQVDLRGPDVTSARRALAAEQVWERCRDSTSVPLRHTALGDLGDGLFAGVVRPALTEHDRLRLRGCLEDTTLERAHLTVVGVGDTGTDDD